MLTAPIREVQIVRKKKSSLALQDILLTIVAYLSYIAFVKGIIPTWAFASFIFVYTFRSFNIRHERAHSSPASGFKSSWLNTFSDYFQVFYLPYHEAYAGKRWKHLAHHRFHAVTNKTPGTLADDPHHIFEEGSPLKALLMSLFYEEVNLALDLKYRGVSKERWLMGVVSLPVIFGLIYFGGLSSFLVLAVVYRLSLMTAWFTFSYAMHVPAIYESRMGDHVPSLLLKGSDILLGHGLSTAVFYHAVHHSKPQGYVRY